MDGIMNNMTHGISSPSVFCACAAAKAALVMLLAQRHISEITLHHNERSGRFTLRDCSLSRRCVRCTVNEVSGVGEDAVHRFPVRAEATVRPRKGVSIETGQGIGRVVKKGMNLPVGEGAVNYVARRMIVSELEDVLDSYYCHKGAHVVLSVPGGEGGTAESGDGGACFKGGVAIVGNAGIVRHCSVPYFKNSLRKQIYNAYAVGCRLPVLAVGNGETTVAGKNIAVKDTAVIRVRNHLGFALRSAAARFDTVLIVGHPERLCKVMLGCFTTHTQKSASPLPWLRSQVGLQFRGTPIEKKAVASSTVDDIVSCVIPEYRLPFFSSIASKMEKRLHGHVNVPVKVGVVLVNRGGACIGIGAQSRQWEEGGCLRLR